MYGYRSHFRVFRDKNPLFTFIFPHFHGRNAPMGHTITPSGRWSAKSPVATIIILNDGWRILFVSISEASLLSVFTPSSIKFKPNVTVDFNVTVGNRMRFESGLFMFTRLRCGEVRKMLPVLSANFQCGLGMCLS